MNALRALRNKVIRSHGGGKAVRWQRRLTAAIRTAARHAAHREHNGGKQ